MSEATAEPDACYTVAIIGDASIGKTTLFQRLRLQVDDPRQYAEGVVCDVTYGMTVGMDFAKITLAVQIGTQTRRIRFRLYDTAGSERFNAIITQYLRDKDAIIYAFEVGATPQATRSIGHVAGKWHPIVQGVLEDAAAIGPTRLVVGTKRDSLATAGDFHAYAAAHLERLDDVLACCCPDKERDMQHVYYTSGRTGAGVQETFAALARHLWARDPPDAFDYMPSPSMATPSMASSAMPPAHRARGATIRVTSTPRRASAPLSDTCCAD